MDASDPPSSKICKSMDKNGNTLITATTSPYENSQYFAKNSWRKRCIELCSLSSRADVILFKSFNTLANPRKGIPGIIYTFPDNLIKNFILISDLRTQIGGFIFKQDDQDHHTSVIRSIFLPPQWGNHNLVTL